MDEITRLLESGYEVTFGVADWTDHAFRRYHCVIAGGEGDVISGLGATPEHALREASPLPPEDGPDPVAERVSALETWAGTAVMVTDRLRDDVRTLAARMLAVEALCEAGFEAGRKAATA